MHNVDVVIAWFGSRFVNMLFNTLSTLFVDKAGRCPKLIVFFDFGSTKAERSGSKRLLSDDTKVSFMVHFLNGLTGRFA